MVFSAEERLMYEVMKAVYDSGIPISFKGSMVLKACLIEAGFSDDTRHTVDIDGNWHSDTPPSGEQMKESLQKALTEHGIDLSVSLYRMYGVGRSAGFELTDNATGEVLFTMDVDVNRPEAPTRLYELEGIRFRGASPLQMTADKLSAVSSKKVFRRIKDVVDLYYMSKVFELDREAVLKVLKDIQGILIMTIILLIKYTITQFIGVIHSKWLLHKRKDPFIMTEEVYKKIKEFSSMAYPDEILDYTQCNSLEEYLSHTGFHLGEIYAITGSTWYFIILNKITHIDLLDFASSSGRCLEIISVYKILMTYFKNRKAYINSRESTSYPLVKILEKRGIFRIQKDIVTSVDGENYHKIWLVIQSPNTPHPPRRDHTSTRS